jgi:hypothetical protein
LNRPTSLALVVAARFGLLLGLALWLGLALATLVLAPVLQARLERAQVQEVTGAVFARVDRWLLGALGILALALAARVALDRAAPPTSLLWPLGLLAVVRLAALFVRRYRQIWLIVVTAEVCVGVYALFAMA